MSLVAWIIAWLPFLLWKSYLGIWLPAWGFCLLCRFCMAFCWALLWLFMLSPTNVSLVELWLFSVFFLTSTLLMIQFIGGVVRVGVTGLAYCLGILWMLLNCLQVTWLDNFCTPCVPDWIQWNKSLSNEEDTVITCWSSAEYQSKKGKTWDHIVHTLQWHSICL